MKTEKNKTTRERDKREIRLRNVRQDLFDLISTIAENSDESNGDIVKKHLDKLVDQYPNHLKIKRGN